MTDKGEPSVYIPTTRFIQSLLQPRRRYRELRFLVNYIQKIDSEATAIDIKGPIFFRWLDWQQRRHMGVKRVHAPRPAANRYCSNLFTLHITDASGTVRVTQRGP
jgi:hypothetical protein